MTHLAEVHTLYKTNARSIPDMLRQSADNIENDPECATSAMVAVQVNPDGDIAVYGWGDLDNFKAIALLHLGLQQVGSIQLDTGE